MGDFTMTTPKSMTGAVGACDALVSVYRTIDRVADTLRTVLITGENGTGKEHAARAVHDSSSRASGPFVAINCSAITESLFESELFGHSRGAFTDAKSSRVGLFAVADGGTLFLDEIGEMPLSLQVKLLRVLQTGEFLAVGSSRPIKSDVRVVAATNTDLERAVAARGFREDLFYRLNMIHLQLPPLRERGADLELLARHFLAKANERNGRTGGLELSPSALLILASYEWPGNVRELENSIERAALLCNGNTIEPSDLPSRIRGLDPKLSWVPRLTAAGVNLRLAVEAFENQLIRQALEMTGWNKKNSAALLGMNRTTLVEMLKRKRFVSQARLKIAK